MNSRSTRNRTETPTWRELAVEMARTIVERNAPQPCVACVPARSADPGLFWPQRDGSVYRIR